MNALAYTSMKEQNESREADLTQRLVLVEQKMKETELTIMDDFNIPDSATLGSIVLGRFYRELEIIDELFIKSEYQDEITKNIIYDEIEERLEFIKKRLMVLFYQ